MEHRFVIFSENKTFLKNTKSLFGEVEVSCVNNLDAVTGAFKKGYINILLIDDSIDDDLYMFLLDKASFFPSRVNFYSISLDKGALIHEKEKIIDPVDYFKRKAG